MRKYLSGSEWTVEGYLPDSFTFNLESGIDFAVGAIIPKIKATVPGSVHRDLMNAGIIQDPYVMDNHLKCEWIENKAFVYETEFCVQADEAAKRAQLTFCGLNFRSRIYLNGELIGTHANVNTAKKIDVSGKLKEKNRLAVQLLPQPEDASQMGKTSECIYQSQRFAYGWDFCTRMIGVGIHKDVYLDFYDTGLIGEIDLRTDCDNDTGIVSVKVTASGECEVITQLFDGETLLGERKSTCESAEHQFTAANVEKWYPNGYGGQKLYTVKIQTVFNHTVQDERVLSFGIRSLSYAQNENSAEDALPYTVVINGEKIYLKGVNFLPVDHLAGTVTRERYERWFSLLKNGNVNLIRLWGGATFENEILFELCDRYGILIWQDFTQSNSGLDGVPSKKPEFLAELKASAQEIVRYTRNVTATVIYTGGNELKRDFSVFRKPVDCSDENIAMLQEIVQREGGGRIFYPSCPCGPNFDNDLTEGALQKRSNHNIHGPWAYCGIEAHYLICNRSHFLYQGEFGVNGMSDESSLLKFFDRQTLEKFKAPDYLWHLRNVTWWNSLPRDEGIFGGIDSVETYVAASQLVQAEGLRYMTESNRRRSFECSGNNIWTFNEPFPNPNCTNMADYYTLPKMAYYYVKRAYAPVSLSLEYDKLYYPVGERFAAKAYLSSLGQDFSGEVKIELFNFDGHILMSERRTVFANKNKAAQVFRFDCEVTEEFGELFFVRLIVNETGNVYLFGTSKAAPYARLKSMPGKIRAEALDDRITVENIGGVVECGICVIERENTAAFEIEDNYITLLPGEKKTLKTSGFLKGNLLVKTFNRNCLIEL